MILGAWNARIIPVGLRRESAFHQVPQDQEGVLGSAAVPASSPCAVSVHPVARNAMRLADAQSAGRAWS